MTATFDIERFRSDLYRTSKRRGFTMKMVSAATGVSQSTLSRMKQGRRPDAASMAALCSWAGMDHRKYLREAMNECASFGIAFSRAQRHPKFTVEDIRRIVCEELARAGVTRRAETEGLGAEGIARGPKDAPKETLTEGAPQGDSNVR